MKSDKTKVGTYCEGILFRASSRAEMPSSWSIFGYKETTSMETRNELLALMWMGT